MSIIFGIDFLKENLQKFCDLGLAKSEPDEDRTDNEKGKEPIIPLWLPLPASGTNIEPGAHLRFAADTSSERLAHDRSRGDGCIATQLGMATERMWLLDGCFMQFPPARM